jgi:stearoyl-CoA desaturase (delta-9 desaturase)
MRILYLSLGLFSFGYLLNIFYITVLYHRGLTHGAVKLNSASLWLIEHTGKWVTGIDPKAWACMHRLHHEHSDTELDPHSPIHYGVFGVAMGQLKSYEKILSRLLRKDPNYTEVVADIPFAVSRLNRKKLWTLPYLLQIAVAVGIGFWAQSAIVGTAYFLGIMSHPVQGWLVNSFAHKFGYRNYEIADHSKNNVWVSYLVFGEGLQNNHHSDPGNANFAHRAFEVDLGYLLCKLGAKVGLYEMKTEEKHPWGEPIW